MLRSATLCLGLLMGGQSRRMGQDKASLDWRGQSLWQHQLRLAAEINAGEILISGKSDGPYRNAARVVPDRVDDGGPLAGLDAVLRAMQSDWLLAVAVDMPLLDGVTLRRLMEACIAPKGVVPVVGERAEPLAAIYPRSVQALVQQQLSSADRSLQSFARRAAAADFVQLLPWPAATAHCFRSVNTPADLAAALQRPTTH